MRLTYSEGGMALRLGCLAHNCKVMTLILGLSDESLNKAFHFHVVPVYSAMNEYLMVIGTFQSLSLFKCTIKCEKAKS